MRLFSNRFLLTLSAFFIFIILAHPLTTNYCTANNSPQNQGGGSLPPIDLQTFTGLRNHKITANPGKQRMLAEGTACGDGQVDQGQDCDDGNTLSNDGCSANCLVQTYYTCSGNPSVCNLNQFLSTLSSLSKDPFSNQFTITFILTPSQAYKSLNWCSVITQTSNLGVSMGSTSYDEESGALSVTFAYTRNINDNSLILSYSLSGNPFANLQEITTQTVLSEQSSNLSLDIYSDSTYQIANALYYTCIVISAVALLFFLIGFINEKIIVLEMVTIFQVVYLSLGALWRMTPNEYAMTGLSLSSGYAFTFMKSNSISNKFAALNLRILFFDNYNISFLLFVLLPMLLSLLFSIIAKTKSQDQNSKLHIMSRKLREQWAFCGCMFSLYICVLSLGFAFIGGSSLTVAEIIGLLMDFGMLAFTCWLCRKLIKRSPDMGEFITCFQKTAWPASNYYFILVIERVLTSIALLLYSSNAQVPIIICFLVVQIVLISFLRPYTMLGKQLRPLLNISISLIIEFLFLFLRFLSDPDYKFIAPLIILLLLLISICYNVYYYICATRKKQKQMEVLKELSQAEHTGDQVKMLNSQRLKLSLKSTLLSDSNQMPSFFGPKSLEDKKHIANVREQLERIRRVSEGEEKGGLKESVLEMTSIIEQHNQAI